MSTASTLWAVRKAFVLGLAALTLASGGAAFAQQASPEAVPVSECTASRLPVDYFGMLVRTPVSGEPYAAPTAVPEGTTVDPATAAEVTALVRQIIACSNSGDLLRALALFEPAYLRRTLDATGQLDPDTANEVFASIATPVVFPEEQYVVLLGIRQMVQLPDGRVAVVVESDGGPDNPEGTDVDLFILRKTGAAWLVADAASDIDDISAANATPTS